MLVQKLFCANQNFYKMFTTLQARKVERGGVLFVPLADLLRTAVSSICPLGSCAQASCTSHTGAADGSSKCQSPRRVPLVSPVFSGKIK